MQKKFPAPLFKSVSRLILSTFVTGLPSAGGAEKRMPPPADCTETITYTYKNKLWRFMHHEADAP
jgi:hypothetical protein